MPDHLKSATSKRNNPTIMSFFGLFGGPAASGSASQKYTLNHLNQLYLQLQNFWQKADAPAADIVETIREITEILIWGENRDSAFFDFFCEKSLLADFVRVLGIPDIPSRIKVQLLQTLSILITNVNTETNLYYLFSNNYINQLIATNFDFSDEEILAYYISLLKSLCLKLNTETVKFFFTRKSFPLYTQAVRFFGHNDQMVRTGVCTLTLAVFRIATEDKLLGEFLITNRNSRLFFVYYACWLRNLFVDLDRTLGGMSMTAEAMKIGSREASPVKRSASMSGTTTSLSSSSKLPRVPPPITEEEVAAVLSSSAVAGRSPAPSTPTNSIGSSGPRQNSPSKVRTSSIAGLLDQIEDGFGYIRDLFSSSSSSGGGAENSGAENLHRVFAMSMLQYWLFPLIFPPLRRSWSTYSGEEVDPDCFSEDFFEENQSDNQASNVLQRSMSFQSTEASDLERLWQQRDPRGGGSNSNLLPQIDVGGGVLVRPSFALYVVNRLCVEFPPTGPGAAAYAFLVQPVLTTLFVPKIPYHLALCAADPVAFRAKLLESGGRGGGSPDFFRLILSPFVRVEAAGGGSSVRLLFEDGRQSAPTLAPVGSRQAQEHDHLAPPPSGFYPLSDEPLYTFGEGTTSTSSSKTNNSPDKNFVKPENYGVVPTFDEVFLSLQPFHPPNRTPSEKFPAERVEVGSSNLNPFRREFFRFLQQTDEDFTQLQALGVLHNTLFDRDGSVRRSELGRELYLFAVADVFRAQTKMICSVRGARTVGVRQRVLLDLWYYELRFSGDGVSAGSQDEAGFSSQDEGKAQQGRAAGAARHRSAQSVGSSAAPPFFPPNGNGNNVGSFASNHAARSGSGLAAGAATDHPDPAKPKKKKRGLLYRILNSRRKRQKNSSMLNGGGTTYPGADPSSTSPPLAKNGRSTYPPTNGSLVKPPSLQPSGVPYPAEEYMFPRSWSRSSIGTSLSASTMLPGRVSSTEAFSRQELLEGLLNDSLTQLKNFFRDQYCFSVHAEDELLDIFAAEWKNAYLAPLLDPGAVCASYFSGGRGGQLHPPGGEQLGPLGGTSSWAVWSSSTAGTRDDVGGGYLQEKPSFISPTTKVPIPDQQQGSSSSSRAGDREIAGVPLGGRGDGIKGSQELLQRGERCGGTTFATLEQFLRTFLSMARVKAEILLLEDGWTKRRRWRLPFLVPEEVEEGLAIGRSFHLGKKDRRGVVLNSTERSARVEQISLLPSVCSWLQYHAQRGSCATSITTSMIRQLTVTVSTPSLSLTVVGSLYNLVDTH